MNKNCVYYKSIKLTRISYGKPDMMHLLINFMEGCPDEGKQDQAFFIQTGCRRIFMKELEFKILLFIP
jgi:hypothetical protein